MSKTLSMVAVLALATSSTFALAGEKSGLQPGDSVPAFVVEKCAGNANDGVEKGATLCYRCKLGGRPVVAVFTRSADENVANLMKEIDTVVEKYSDKQAASFVNLIGKDADALKQDASKLVEHSGAKNVAVVVPNDNENGPASYKLNPKVDVTVLVYNRSKVQANHSLSAKELNKAAIAQIISDAEKMLK
ncbi:MAG: hypothetical protein KDA42_00685 [Planctomycetales bacterium]|nr:hypothetical protein [Planctomycetales bacterium]